MAINIEERVIDNVNMDFTASLEEGVFGISDISFVYYHNINTSEGIVFEGFEIELEGDQEHEVYYQIYLLKNGEVYANRAVIYTFEDLQASFYNDRNLLHHLGTIIIKPSEEADIKLYKLMKGVVNLDG